ncbi:MAG: hypothetical protein WCE80_06230 [Acidimicrobiia bacterium]
MIRRIYAGLAWLYLTGVVAQFALAGLGLPQLGGAGMAAHADFGYIALHLTPILLVIASLVGRVGRRLIWLTVTLALVVFAQPIWVTVFRGTWVAALHIVGAGVVLVLSWQVARGATSAARVPGEPGRDHPSSLQRLRSASSVTSGRALLLAMLVLLVCDVIGGFVALALGANSFSEAWGFDTQNTVPLPVGVAQLVLAWLAARNTRPPIGYIAAVTLGVFCLISIMAGLFDGDLIQNVASDGVLSLGVAWAVVLLAVTTVVGLLAAMRAKQLRRRR